MAKYRAVERVYIKPAGHRTPLTIEAGTVFEFNGRPGLSLQPLDAAADAAKLESISKYYRGNNPTLFRLAKSLGAPEVGTWTAARAYIFDWIKEHRESADV
jgi:hypothetical protein